MIPYFSIIENKDKFKKIVNSWLGTPYKHYTRVKGRGTDCVLWLADSFFEMGILTKLEYDYYSRDWYMHTTKEVVLNNFKRHIKKYLKSNLCIKEINVKDNDLMFGDWVLYSYCQKTNLSNHVVLMYEDKKIVECIIRRGVIITDVKDKPIKHIFRVFIKE